MQHLVLRSVLRAGDGDHENTPGRHARLRAVPPRASTRSARRSSASTSSTTARRFSTSAPSRCASTSRRTTRTSISTRARTVSRSATTRVRRLVGSGIDEVTFSIDGATPESYLRYRQRGIVRSGDRATSAAAIDEKHRRGADVPVRQLALHPLQLERQRSRDARARASWPRDLGVDRLCWEITDHPESAFSRRFAPGTRDHAAIRHEIWDDNQLGNAIPGATPRARIALRDLDPDAPVDRRAPARLVSLPVRIRNLSQRTFPATTTYGYRLVRLGGAAAPTPTGRTIERDSRARCPCPAAVRQRPIRGPVDRRPGARASRPLSARVRPRVRRRRLVRELRIGNHGPRVRRRVRRARRPDYRRRRGRARRTATRRSHRCRAGHERKCAVKSTGPRR